MYFRVNLKIKKPLLCYCFTWIVFIELNFTVAVIEENLGWPICQYGGGWGILRNGGS